MGVYMVIGSLVRAGLAPLGSALMDWHWRNAQVIYIFFSLATLMALCACRPPKVIVK